jgi:hypothetical protein
MGAVPDCLVGDSRLPVATEAQAEVAMRFHFTIRDLLWLTLVVAMAAGWWLDNKKLSVERVDLPMTSPDFDSTPEPVVGR